MTRKIKYSFIGQVEEKEGRWHSWTGLETGDNVGVLFEDEYGWVWHMRLSSVSIRFVSMDRDEDSEGP